MFKNNPALAQLKASLATQEPSKPASASIKPASASARTVEGTVSLTGYGYGFLDVAEGESYFIAPDEAEKLFPGDQIKAEIRASEKGDYAAPVSLIESKFLKGHHLGHIRKKMVSQGDSDTLKPIYFVAFEDITVKKWVRVSDRSMPFDFKGGEVVAVSLSHHPMTKERRPVAMVNNVIGNLSEPMLPWNYSLYKHGISNLRMPASDIPEGFFVGGQANRTNAEFIKFFTIDSTATNDMDDAIQISERGQNGWHLKVLISDPAEYIEEGGAIDAFAKGRPSSVYLPSMTLPMLPKRLSDGELSLHPQQRRYGLCCELQINKDGSVEDYKFSEVVALSHAKLNYQDVTEFVTGESDIYAPVEVKKQLPMLRDMAVARRTYREQQSLVFNGRADFHFMIQDYDVKEIRKTVMSLGHSMVEEAMLAANECAAKFLKKNKTGIFMTHSGFDPKRYKEIREKLVEWGMEQYDFASVEGYVGLMKHLRDQDESLDRNLRRYSSGGMVSKDPDPHFGLGLDCYATFTSPIRKYWDLVNHRCIKALLRGEAPPEITQGLIDSINEFRSAMRRTELSMQGWMYARYYESRIGEEYDARVDFASKTVIRVELEDSGLMLSVPLHPRRHTVEVTDIGVSVDGKLIKFGDVLKVKLKRCNMLNRQFEADLIE